MFVDPLFAQGQSDVAAVFAAQPAGENATRMAAEFTEELRSKRTFGRL